MKILVSRTFDWWEVALLKVCLISLGIALGLNFTSYLAPFMWLWWVAFVLPAVYFIARFFRGK